MGGVTGAAEGADGAAKGVTGGANMEGESKEVRWESKRGGGRGGGRGRDKSAGKKAVAREDTEDVIVAKELERMIPASSLDEFPDGEEGGGIQQQRRGRTTGSAEEDDEGDGEAASSLIPPPPASGLPATRTVMRGGEEVAKALNQRRLSLAEFKLSRLQQGARVAISQLQMDAQAIKSTADWEWRGLRDVWDMYPPESCRLGDMVLEAVECALGASSPFEKWKGPGGMSGGTADGALLGGAPPPPPVHPVHSVAGERGRAKGGKGGAKDVKGATGGTKGDRSQRKPPTGSKKSATKKKSKKKAKSGDAGESILLEGGRDGEEGMEEAAEESGDVWESGPHAKLEGDGEDAGNASGDGKQQRESRSPASLSRGALRSVRGVSPAITDPTELLGTRSSSGGGGGGGGKKKKKKATTTKTTMKKATKATKISPVPSSVSMSDLMPWKRFAEMATDYRAAIVGFDKRALTASVARALRGRLGKLKKAVRVAGDADILEEELLQRLSAWARSVLRYYDDYTRSLAVIGEYEGRVGGLQERVREPSTELARESQLTLVTKGTDDAGVGMEEGSGEG